MTIPGTGLSLPAPVVRRDDRPGLDPRRLVRLMHAAIDRLDLDLGGRLVVTEAATGAYVITPVLAALAGAEQVQAVAQEGPYATLGQVLQETRDLAEAAGLERTIQVVTQLDDADLSAADIVTNSGSVRPIDARAIRRMRAGAVVPLMYETWLLRTGDVDLEMCRERGVLCGGTNERHPDVDVFGYHGVMAARLLTDAGIPVHGTHVLLLCDNSFGPYLQRTLTACGATVTVRDRLAAGPVDAVWDAVLVALRPCPWPVLDRVDVEALRAGAPSTVVVQYWGDLDREALQAARVPVWPPVAPPTGRMAILPSAVGPDPLVRLQAAGLKVAELLLRPDGGRTGPFRDLPQPLWGPTGAGR